MEGTLHYIMPSLLTVGHVKVISQEVGLQVPPLLTFVVVRRQKLLEGQ